jgi:outer membrane protein TolC
MSSRLLSGAGALVIILTAGHALAAAQDQRFKPAGKPQKASASKLVVSVQPAPLGATVESVLAAGRRLNPALRAAALDTSAAAAKAAGADALDDPTISDSYQYYRNPGVFSGHSIMVTQAFPLWGKLDLRREAALADLDAVRGHEQAARDTLDERIKVAFAQYYVASRALTVNLEVIAATRGMRAAGEARYAAGQGDQAAVIKALGEETAAEIETARLEGDRAAAREVLNALLARPGSAPLAEPLLLRRVPAANLATASLMERARGGSPALAASGAEVDAARTRTALAEKAWYPDLTVGAGPLIQTNNRPPGVAATVGLCLGAGRLLSNRRRPHSWARPSNATRLRCSIYRVRSAKRSRGSRRHGKPMPWWPVKPFRRHGRRSSLSLRTTPKGAATLPPHSTRSTRSTSSNSNCSSLSWTSRRCSLRSNV